MDLVTEQKLERRERILEAARDLISEHGYDGLTMRDLAAHCRVSVPTLYNQFGSKNALLAHAVEAHFSGLLGGARDARWKGHKRLVGVVDVCAQEMARLPTYYRSLMGAFLAPSTETVPLQAHLARDLVQELEGALEELREAGQLASWADPAVLSRQITAGCIASTIVWSLGGLQDEELRASMVHAAAAVTLGVTSGAARSALEKEARKAQAVLAGGRATAAAKKAGSRR